MSASRARLCRCITRDRASGAALVTVRPEILTVNAAALTA